MNIMKKTFYTFIDFIGDKACSSVGQKNIKISQYRRYLSSMLNLMIFEFYMCT